ncbi:MAG: TonB-dependent receptor [Pseudomonadota bacterium]|nr:TonB-dependent receptor [Pseudomonadota bacterium]
MKTRLNILKFFTATFVALIAIPLSSIAQISLEEIVVTARKRSESLLEIPVAITAFSSAQMEAIGAPNLVDLAKFTPGLQFNEQAVSEPGRVYTAIRFRGLGSEIKEPFGQIGSAFLDGIYMPGGVSSLGNENFERIEVVKGPSSAWLGRSTFAGAVNFITKTPNLNEFKGRISSKLGEDGLYDMTFGHEGPLVEDKVAYRVFVRGYGTDGQYSSSDGNRLGEQRTDTAMLTLYSEPTESLSIKVHGIYTEDKDSGPAQAFMSGPLGLRGNNTTNVTNCLATRTAGQTRANGQPLTDFICGEIPKRLDLVDSSTSISSDLIRFWNEIVPPFPGAPYIDMVGLRREQTRLSFDLNYDLNATGFFEGSSISVLAGYGKENSVFIRDFDLTPVDNWLSRDPSQNKVKQFEVRINSGEDQDLNWMLGASIFDGSFQATFQGGEVAVGHDGGLAAVIPAFDMDNFLGNPVDGICPCAFPPLTIGPETGGLTKGIFGTIGYQISEEFSFDFEWRYQEDEITVILPGATDLSGFPAPVQAFGTGNGGELGQKFNKFLPRVTLQYQPNDVSNYWATFSRGNTPGYFNGDIVNRVASDIALIQAQVATSVFVEEEQLDNYEIGWKQQLMDNRVNFSLVAYYMEWKNQKTRTGATIDRPDGSQIAANLTISGFSTEFKGIEFEGSAAATENLTIDWGLNWADAEFKNLECGFTDDYQPPNAQGQLICDGNRPVQFPEWSGSLAGTYVGEINDVWNYFVRWDVSYTGKRYADEANFAYVGDQWLSSLRVGFTDEDLRVEAFVTNLFNDKTWTSGGRWTDFSADRGGLFPFEFTAQQGIALGAPTLRQVGVRASYNF